MTIKKRVCALSLLGVLAATAAAAQSNTMPQGYPEFRDPMTGKVWTPENVGKDGAPVPFDDRAFEPRAQAGGAPGMIVQQPRPRLLGTVPITSAPGTNVPTVTVEMPSLFADPGRRWVAVMYLNNNSAAAVQPVVDCTFTNNNQPVLQTRVMVGATNPGDRLGMFIGGPRTDIFVDAIVCRVQSPT